MPTGGAFWYRHIWAQTVVLVRALRPRFFLSVGCVFIILGSSLTVSLSDASVTGHKTASVFAFRVDAARKWHIDAKGYKVNHFGSSFVAPTSGRNSRHTGFVVS